MIAMDGVLIIDKPAGMTSHDVVARVRRITGQRRVGHTGTLDPFATGVLVILVGRATRLAQFLSGADKEYEAVIRLGYATDTGDITGVRIGSDAGAQTTPSFSREEIESALASRRGEIEQTPPMYSAKKIGGRKLYELARRGEEIERKSVRVNISLFESLAPDDDMFTPHEDGSNDLRVRVVCSAGTYIRTLAEDFGRQLGVGAHVAELRRTRAGRFSISQAVTLDQLSAMAESIKLDAARISPDAAISHLPEIGLSDDEVGRALHGAGLQIENDSIWPDGQAVRMRDDDGQLVAVGTYDEARRFLHPSVVIASND